MGGVPRSSLKGKETRRDEGEKNTSNPQTSKNPPTQNRKITEAVAMMTLPADHLFQLPSRIPHSHAPASLGLSGRAEKVLEGHLQMYPPRYMDFPSSGVTSVNRSLSMRSTSFMCQLHRK